MFHSAKNLTILANSTKISTTLYRVDSIKMEITLNSYNSALKVYMSINYLLLNRQNPNLDFDTLISGTGCKLAEV